MTCTCLILRVVACTNVRITRPFMCNVTAKAFRPSGPTPTNSYEHCWNCPLVRHVTSGAAIANNHSALTHTNDPLDRVFASTNCS